jgi:two-component system, chemotaxis family, chemotaxis protein CheY
MAKVLIVDDAAFVRMRESKLLQEHGYEIMEATNGVEAIAKYKETKPDAVLLDITMPDMDGLTALEEIRKFDPDAKVAMVTAVGQESNVMEALRKGAKDFIVKPYEPERLLAALTKLIGER